MRHHHSLRLLRGLRHLQLRHQPPSTTLQSRTIGTVASHIHSTQSPSDTWVPSLSSSVPGHSSTVDPFRIVSSDLAEMTRSIRETISVLQHPLLDNAASHLLSLHGKRIRPLIVLLMAHATAVALPSATLLPTQLRLAEITELIHAASLLHDDVIDVAETRRGAVSVNSLFGNQLAVLAGDFLLARASVALARLRDCDVVELLSTVIEHLVRGEVIQMKGGLESVLGGIGDVTALETTQMYHQPQNQFEAYIAKTFFKTASLLANSCRAVTMLAGHNEEIAKAAYSYGENVGIAFQLVDDMLDMTASEDMLGKPILNDLRLGHATAPVLFAMKEFPQVREMMDRKFSADGDLERTQQLVDEVDGLGQTRDLATMHVQRGLHAIIDVLPPSDHRSALINIAEFVLTRQR